MQTCEPLFIDEIDVGDGWINIYQKADGSYKAGGVWSFRKVMPYPKIPIYRIKVTMKKAA